MERGSNSKKRITKTRRFPQETTRKLESSKEINRNGKENCKEAI